MISAVILTKNEEKNLQKCLEGLSFCDEVVVIDDNSTDKTALIAKKYGARVIHRALQDFSSQRNFGLEEAKGEWVLFVDADERVSKKLREEIQTAVIENKNGFYVKRTDFMWGRELGHGEVGNIQLLRLAKKGKGKWEGKAHEVWQIKGEIGILSSPLYHYPHPTISEFITEINHYSSLRAEELKEEGTRASFITIIVYPKAKFFMTYIVKLGFLDGVSGLVLATMMSLHSFLVRGKLWLLWQKHSGK